MASASLSDCSLDLLEKVETEWKNCSVAVNAVLEELKKNVSLRPQELMDTWIASIVDVIEQADAISAVLLDVKDDQISNSTNIRPTFPVAEVPSAEKEAILIDLGTQSFPSKSAYNSTKQEAIEYLADDSDNELLPGLPIVKPSPKKESPGKRYRHEILKIKDSLIQQSAHDMAVHSTVTLIEVDETVETVLNSGGYNGPTRIAPHRSSIIGDDWEFAGCGAFDYQKLSISDVSSKIKCHVAYITSPANFFVDIHSSSSIYDKMNDDLQDYVLLLASEKFSLDRAGMRIESDFPCIAPYDTDGKYYRAVVDTVGNEECHVAFVDYGNLAIVRRADCYPLPVHFIGYPAAAIQCSLTGVDSCELTTDVVQSFRRTVREGDVVFIEVEREKEEKTNHLDSKSYSVVLYGGKKGHKIDWKAKSHDSYEKVTNVMSNENFNRSNEMSDLATGGSNTDQLENGQRRSRGGFDATDDDEELERVLQLSKTVY